jgi:amidophosphoribosyltransferase
MVFYDGKTFTSGIHNIRNSPFRTKFELDLERLSGHMGIGCISDSDPQR